MKTDDMEAISSLPTLSVKRWKVSPVDLFRGMVELSKLKKSSTEDYKIQGYYIKALLEDRTRLFIRDALYWLAWSAPQRQAAGGSSNQTSEEYEVEPSTSGGFQGLVCQGSHASLSVAMGTTNIAQRSLSSSLLQLSRGGNAGVHGYGLSKYTCWGWQKTSKSFFTALPEGFKFQWHRENAIDGQNECTSNVEIEEDNDDVEDELMEGQFDQFAMARAFNDDEMAEKALQEMGSALEVNQMKHLMKGMTEIEKQLHRLYKEMNRMIEEGDQAPANDMIEAKYKSVKGQFESGIQGMEQAAMLDVLAQLCMSLGKAEEVACLLSEHSLKLVTSTLGSNSPQISIPLECLATTLHHLDRDDEAEPLACQALKLCECSFGSNSATAGEVSNCLASILHSLGRNEEAATLMSWALAIQEEEIGPGSPIGKGITNSNE
ncbi:unnamed protein product [Sphagnum jensenii]|uniref:Uncharacterized protein n=1 Tax=Sphagnum jensenii TaxID=128206 RepID=A0ABP0WXM0_9BRYO